MADTVSVRVGSIPMDLPVVRCSSADLTPTSHFVCYAHRDDGKMVLALHRNGKWMGHNRKPLGFVPDYWLKIGGRD